MPAARYDAIVVGSGFGGAVTAARLAERGMRVLVLERGPWWGSAGEGDVPARRRAFPRGAFGVRKALRNVRFARGKRSREWVLHSDGLFEIHAFAHLDVYTASGVGGGSLVYTNIMAQPEDAFFEAFPPELSARELAPYFVRVRTMLDPKPLPTRPDKNLAFERACATAGFGAPHYPDLAIAFGADPAVAEPRINAAGVAQNTCTYCGECILGCPTRAKTTLDLTYLPVAQRHGAELRALAEVVRLEVEGSGFRVGYLDRSDGSRHEVIGDRLVLAAGTLNTQRLLFQARDRDRTLPNVSAALGQRFSPNADMLGVAIRSAIVTDSSVGPSLNAYVERRTEDGRPFVVGELSLPLRAMPLPGFVRDPLRRTALLVAMGQDSSSAHMFFDGRAGLVSDAGRSMDPDMFAAIEGALGSLAHAYEPWRAWLNAPAGKGSPRLATVHPLGGAAVGRGPTEGVVAHTGEVFGHPRLYVADGALYPRAPGIPPSLTIAALAERQAALMT